MNSVKDIVVYYLLPFITLLGGLLIYFRLAERFNIIDKPNDRSSHTIPTIRGGGVIFLLAVVLYFVWSGFNFPFLLTALLVSGVISFIDDIHPLPNLLKFGAHLASVILLFKECGLLNGVHPLYLVAIGVVVIGIINAYNFMDGINGITGLYSLAIVIPLFTTESNLQVRVLELFLLMSLIVFNFFNTRRKARCFAGDVGSITLAIIIVFLLIMRIIETGNFAYLGMLLIYGIDTVYTLMNRLLRGENIFKPHRKHLYQYLGNEGNMSHLSVSTAIALLQVIVNFSIVSGNIQLTGVLVILIVLSIIYWIIKAPFFTSNNS